MSECGFIGLGRMVGRDGAAAPQCRTRVVVYDSSEAAVAALAAHGAHVAASAQAVAQAASVVFLSLPNPQIVMDVVLGPRGIRDRPRP